jgi:MAternally affected uncoordination
MLKKFQILLYENLIRCKISIGNRKDAIKNINECVEICKTDLRLLQTHSIQLHVLLGLYAMSLNQHETAETQFKHALRVFFYFYLNLERKIIYLNN